MSMYLPNADVGAIGNEPFEFIDEVLLPDAGPEPPTPPEDHDRTAEPEQ